MRSNIKNIQGTIIKLPQYLETKKKLYKRDGYCKIDQVFKESFVSVIKKDIINGCREHKY